MKPKHFISRFSNNFLLALVCVIFSINFSSFTILEISGYNQAIEIKESEKSVKANGVPPRFIISEQPATNNSSLSKLFIAFATFLIFFLCLSKNKFAYLFSGFLLVIPLGYFFRWFIGTQQLLFWIENSDFVTGTNKILFRADFIDFLSLSFISLLFIWLFSISVNNFYSVNNLNLNGKRKLLLP